MSKCEVCLNEARVLTATGNGYACDSCTAKMPREHVVASEVMVVKAELLDAFQARLAAQSRLVAAAEAVENSVTAIKKLQRCQGYAGRYDDYVRLVKECDIDLTALRAAVEERGKV